MPWYGYLLLGAFLAAALLIVIGTIVSASRADDQEDEEWARQHSLEG